MTARFQERLENLTVLLLSNKPIHQHVMAEASAHDKEMEYFMGAKAFVPGIKDGKL